MAENFDEEALRKIQEEANMNRLSVSMEQDERELPTRTFANSPYSPQVEYAVAIKLFMPDQVTIRPVEIQGQKITGVNTYQFHEKGAFAKSFLEKQDTFRTLTQPLSDKPLVPPDDASVDTKRLLAYTNMVQAQIYENMSLVASTPEEEEKYRLKNFIMKDEAKALLTPLEEKPTHEGFREFIMHDAERFFTGHSEMRIIDDGQIASDDKQKVTWTPELENKKNTA